MTDAHGDSGHSYTVMGWINCSNEGGSWANIWHLSPTNKNVPRNPSLYIHVGGRYLHSCYTNRPYTNHNVNFNSSYRIIYGDWHHVT